MALVLMTIVRADQGTEKTIEQLITRWVVAGQLTFVFWAKEDPQKICVRVQDHISAWEFEGEFRRYHPTSSEAVTFDVLTERHMADIDAISTLL